ncbi:hypothetical protein NDU88_008056 [Pleurodeles waltl]|uniref:Uncharacterized protein n=1 Tax=Pleurodeles waltl TaxID=8319 RepID=A0AAV7RS26_PLEWA|nr:hypothetical protein NDU88_008056 [Pleurodeles waltl]
MNPPHATLEILGARGRPLRWFLEGAEDQGTPQTSKNSDRGTRRQRNPGSPRTTSPMYPGRREEPGTLQASKQQSRDPAPVRPPRNMISSPYLCLGVSSRRGSRGRSALFSAVSGAQLRSGKRAASRLLRRPLLASFVAPSAECRLAPPPLLTGGLTIPARGARAYSVEAASPDRTDHAAALGTTRAPGLSV